MATREIQPCDLEMVRDYLAKNLRIELQRTSNYTGGLDGSGQLYRDSHTIELTLDGQVISYIDL